MIEAEMDTRNFVGLKATTLSVTLVTASGSQAVAAVWRAVEHPGRHRVQPGLG